MVGKLRGFPIPGVPVLAALAGTGIFFLPVRALPFFTVVPCIAASVGVALSAFTGPDRRSLSPILFAGLLLVSLLARIGLERETRGAYAGLPPDRITGFRGCVVDDGRYSEDGTTRALVGVHAVTGRDGTETSAEGRVLLLVRGPAALSRGMHVRVAAPTMPAEGDGGIAFVAFPDAASVAVEGWGSRIGRVRHDIRETLRARIRSLGGTTAALFEALFLGRQDDLPARLKDGFRKSGSAHVLALSGMHLGILALLASFLLRPVAGRPGALLASLLVVLPYVAVAGPSPSLLRAGLMYLLAVPFLVAGRKIDPLVLLGAACWLVPVMAPSSIATLSSQLSFLSLAGVLIIGRPAAFLLRGALPPVLAAPVAASLGAQLATLPILLGTFGTVYPAGILSTLILGPLVTLFVWSGIAFLPATLLPIAAPAAFLRGVSEALARTVVFVADGFSLLPGFSPPVEPAAAAFSVAAATVFLYLSLRRKRDAAAV